MNFEKIERDKGGFTSEVPRIRFFDSLSCTRESNNQARHALLQLVTHKRYLLFFQQGHYCRTVLTAILCLDLICLPYPNLFSRCGWWQDMFCFGMLMPLAIYGVFLWAYSAIHGEGRDD